MSIQNKALTVTFFWFLNRDLKTTPTFALEKQTRFILTLPVAGAVNGLQQCFFQTCNFVM